LEKDKNISLADCQLAIIKRYRFADPEDRTVIACIGDAENSYQGPGKENIIE